jgi:hypothetical protein
MPVAATPTEMMIALSHSPRLMTVSFRFRFRDRTVSGHHSHPSTRNARSIYAVAISMSDSSLACAVFSNSSAAKSQYGRACRHDFICPMKRAASSPVR